MIGYRVAEEGDMRFIRHAWVESFRTSHYAGVIPMKIYFQLYHDIIREILERDGTRVLIAFNSSHPSQIFAFLAHEAGFSLPLVHYVYVKEDFRQLPQKDSSFKNGLATMLMQKIDIPGKDPFYYTFKTGIWSRLTKWSGPFSGAIYKPLYARFDEVEAKAHDREHSKHKTQAKEEQKCA